MAKRQRALTDADKQCAAKARELWKKFREKNPGISQEAAAARAGMGQSAFSQFLLGIVPMRVQPVLKFAGLFGVNPRELRDDLPELLYDVAPPASPKHVARGHVGVYEKLGASDAQKLLLLIRTFMDTSPQGRDELYAQALAVMSADADEHGSAPGRPRHRRAKRR